MLACLPHHYQKQTFDVATTSRAQPAINTTDLKKGNGGGEVSLNQTRHRPELSPVSLLAVLFIWYTFFTEINERHFQMMNLRVGVIW